MIAKYYVYCLTCMKAIFSDYVGKLCGKPAEDHVEMHFKKNGTEARVTIGYFVDRREDMK